jgi:large subunit ribosomal protein L3
MIDTLLTKKIRMTQAFVNNARVPVTVLAATPNVVTMVKNEKRDGYNALQIGFGTRRAKNTSKALQGHLKATTIDNKSPRHLKEVHSDEVMDLGTKIAAQDIFVVGDTIQVTGISKGKGFAGGVKRHGFKGGPKTHGQSDRLRAPGSIGQGTTPGRVHKGKRMAGHMGTDQVTVKNLIVVAVDADKNEIHVKGPVPGAKGSIVIVKRLSENKVVPVEAAVVEEVTQTEEEVVEGGQTNE